MLIFETAIRDVQVLFLQATPLPYLLGFESCFPGSEFYTKTVGFPKANKGSLIAKQ